MIPTVQRGVRKQPVAENEYDTWINREVLPFLAQVRQALNYVNRQQATISTAATATFTTIWSSADLGVNTAVRLDAYIQGIATAARAAFTITGLFYNNGATAQEGATVAGYTQNAAGYAVRYQVVGNHIDVQVQDAGVATVNWTAVIDAQVAP